MFIYSFYMGLDVYVMSIDHAKHIIKNEFVGLGDVPLVDDSDHILGVFSWVAACNEWFYIKLKNIPRLGVDDR